MMLLLGYTPACTTIGKYGIGPEYIVDKLSVEEVLVEEVSKNATGSSDASVDRSIMSRLYGFLNVESEQAVDSNGFIGVSLDMGNYCTLRLFLYFSMLAF
ncbi:MAG: hypothetical protein NMK33_00375 [Candidatus Cardinium sp.]|uniref:hypothetical protein n=1 Tax=Cardinium endosymbiont of Dermatophagoides farinae TaxID=2597823 RepID=UPI0011905CA0|nr:hypothetical protein [Cardinium endosymbiont of Dermatophagoides farinae]TSJ80987.1 hypothetical protein FPG78_03055 [Cardinium endosymbiont of Dermatophagoides farinae]UWW97013.1 MAG: hypothetical protein NMK33_00375 [Candidatus Cardinium sp.]